jgi:hypothetical protein
MKSMKLYQTEGKAAAFMIGIADHVEGRRRDVTKVLDRMHDLGLDVRACWINEDTWFAHGLTEQAAEAWADNLEDAGALAWVEEDEDKSPHLKRDKLDTHRGRLPLRSRRR